MKYILLYKAKRKGRYLKYSDYQVIGKTIVDDEDFDIFNKYRWFLHSSGYSCRKENYYFNNIRRTHTIYLHREIINCPKNKFVDHINHETLDNRKENLRVVTNQENHMNGCKRNGTSSKYKGVYKHTHANKWQAQLTFNQQLFYLGIFNSEVEAAKAYNEKAKELFGDYAKLNEV